MKIRSDQKPSNILRGTTLIVYHFIIKSTKPHFWALENPVGRLPRYIGKYRYTFQPYEYGDPWTKRTCIWGNHNILVKCPVEIDTAKQSLAGSPSKTMIYKRLFPSWIGGSPDNHHGIVDNPEMLPANWIHSLPPSADRAALRAITPLGFARAFFEANR